MTHLRHHETRILGNCRPQRWWAWWIREARGPGVSGSHSPLLEGVALGGGVDRWDQQVWSGVLEEEAPGTGPEGAAAVFVGVEGGDDDDRCPMTSAEQSGADQD